MNQNRFFKRLFNFSRNLYVHHLLLLCKKKKKEKNNRDNNNERCSRYFFRRINRTRARMRHENKSCAIGRKSRAYLCRLLLPRNKEEAAVPKIPRISAADAFAPLLQLRVPRCLAYMCCRRRQRGYISNGRHIGVMGRGICHP